MEQVSFLQFTFQVKKKEVCLTMKYLTLIIIINLMLDTM